MKRLSGILCLLIIAVGLYGQRRSDYGVMAGVSSYLGDINPNRLLYSPGLAGGIFYRYNLHPRQAIRASVLLGGIKGDDLDFSNDFQITRAGNFSGMITEFAVQFEFNFLPYSTMGKVWNYSPYFAAGIGGTFVNSHGTAISGGAPVNSSGAAVVPVIPFSLGFKINIHKNIGLEAEYGFRKTFYDNFDRLKDWVAPSDYAWTHNNDWYTFTGVAITWKFYSRLAGCPAYKDVDSKRKR